MGSDQTFLMYQAEGLKESFAKLDNKPSMLERWALIQRMFLMMIRVYFMGEKREGL